MSVNTFSVKTSYYACHDEHTTTVPARSHWIFNQALAKDTAVLPHLRTDTSLQLQVLVLQYPWQ